VIKYKFCVHDPVGTGILLYGISKPLTALSLNTNSIKKYTDTEVNILSAHCIILL
jgi:hypothetical protein